MRRRVPGASETLAVAGRRRGLAHARRATCRSRPGSPRRSTGWRRSSLLGRRAPRRRGGRPHARLGAQVRRGPGGRPRGRPRAARAAAMTDVRRRDDRARPAAAGRGASAGACTTPGVPVTPERAGALRARARRSCARSPRRRLYWTARSVFVSDQAQVAAFDARVRRGVRRPTRRRRAGERPRAPAAAPRRRAARRATGGRRRRGRRRRAPRRATRTAPRSRSRSRWPATRSGCASKRFDALEPRRARAALPADDAARARDAAAPHAPPRARPPRPRRSTCAARCARSLRTGGEPIRLARRRRRDRAAAGS